MKQTGLAPAFDGLRSTKQWGRLNASHGAASGKRDGDGRRRHRFRKFRDHEEIIVPGREKSSMNGPTKILNRNADGIEAILGVANQAVPRICGVADLMAKIRHFNLLSQ